CCPLPGEVIMGAVALGNHGITIHRQDCSNLAQTPAERRLPVRCAQAPLGDCIGACCPRPTTTNDSSLRHSANGAAARKSISMRQPERTIFKRWRSSNYLLVAGATP
ncbi:MAG: hypothetical protein EBZ86_07140, partial [Synechococcaceae bacterium WB9_2_069]|nr:hypothetical protein [Synechococcaceae bacterium WB9_2_069]